ncbi:unnamed protein product [Prunus armeniaca]|uniref:Uncharacterized protein n=1 Tax=Prunus armeniaca TaxID=36596 RepID=A0A6J5TWH6_PRUAR|nr:unnamed protein product [Prunus armeniaca]
MSKARGEEEEDTECFYNSLGELWLVGGNWSLGWDKGKKKSGTKGGGGRGWVGVLGSLGVGG